MEMTDSPDVVIAKRLLDHARLSGFTFQRIAPGEDAPLVGYRLNEDCVDLIHIEGFNRGCFAWRKRATSLIVSKESLVHRRVEGSALKVLNDVLTWEQRSCGRLSAVHVNRAPHRERQTAKTS